MTEDDKKFDRRIWLTVAFLTMTFVFASVGFAATMHYYPVR